MASKKRLFLVDAYAMIIMPLLKTQESTPKDRILPPLWDL
jgi:hypothetical protein